jgi:hypothetical protein
MDRNKKTNCVALLLGCVRDQVHSQRENTMNELKSRITAAIADVTKNMLQSVWKEVGYRWDVCRATKGSHCGVFCT